MEKNTNSSLRDHLIFKHVPENANKKETWAQSVDKVAEVIETISKKEISHDEAYDMIVRGHRGKVIEGQNGPRPIFTQIDDWRNLDLIMGYVKKNYYLTNVKIEPQFGPITTWQRNKAMQLRKELKAKKEIIGGYVDYPAILMVKYPGQSKFVQKGDFSNMPMVSGN